MSLTLEPYPEYRDSGLPWLGEIPAHWEVHRLRSSVLECRNGVWGSDPDGNDDIACIRVADFDRYALRVRVANPTMRAVTPSERHSRLLRNGDLLLEKSGGGELQAVGAVMLFDHDAEAVCSNFVARMSVAPGFDSHYLTYLHFYLYSIRLNVRSIKQTTGIQNLDSDAYLNELTAFPNEAEQRDIARFLDNQTVRVYDLIRAKQRLIELLTEQKQAIIHHAVTRGLDPDAPTKPTGLDWLPEVPEHWDIKLLKQVGTVRLSGVDKHSIDGEQPVLLCNYTDVYNNDFITGEINFMHATATETEINAFTLETGDVLITKDSEASDDIAAPALVCEDLGSVLCGYHLALVRPNATLITGEYLFRAFSEASVSRQFHMSATGVTRFGISKQHIKNALIPLPPLDEQTKICRLIAEENRTIDAAIERARREIELIREYRTRLISDVVTGKLDVRQKTAATQPKKANIHFYRSVLAAEIVDQYQNTPKFGRIKLQKAMILAERHLRMDEIQSEPLRAAAGPFDNKMMRSVHAQLQRQKWFEPKKRPDGPYEYISLEKRGGHRKYFERYWGNKREAFNQLLSLLKPMSTDQTEIVATLYMVWNDFLVLGEKVDDNRLVYEATQHWDKSKRRFTEDQWRNAISWMRKYDLVPQGFGTLTKRPKSSHRSTDIIR